MFTDVIFCAVDSSVGDCCPRLVQLKPSRFCRVSFRQHGLFLSGQILSPWPFRFAGSPCHLDIPRRPICAHMLRVGWHVFTASRTIARSRCMASKCCAGSLNHRPRVVIIEGVGDFITGDVFQRRPQSFDFFGRLRKALLSQEGQVLSCV